MEQTEDSILEQFIVERRVDGALIGRLTALPPASCAAIEQLITQIQPSANWLREVLDLAEEISTRDSVSCDETLCCPELLEILQCDLGRKDKQRRYRATLEAKRFPRRSLIEQRLSELQREISRSHQLQIEYPSDLEGDQFACTVTFRSASELSDVAKRLEALAQSGRVEELRGVLCGCAEDIAELNTRHKNQIRAQG